MEDSLGQLVERASSLASFLLESKNIETMDSLTEALEISRNDVPLLLTIAQVQSPQLARTYGLGRH